MKRKDFIKTGLLTAIGATTIASCVPPPNEKYEENVSDAPNIITGKKYKWKMVTTWGANFAVLGEVANYFAQWVNEMSTGRIEIQVYGAGELVPPLEVFDAVSGGNAEMGAGAAYYWAGKSPIAQFFAAVPFGMNAQQITSWMVSGGGYELWKETYAPFNVVPFLGGNSGVQMGGWFNREINSIADLKGLKMRLPGLAGKVLEKAGGAPILVAGSEIYTSLERGVIDATEWIGPYHDYKKGLHKIAKYYYTPGWHETGSQLEFTMNKGLYDSLPKDLQQIIVAASMRAQLWVLSEFEAKNGFYLDKLINEEGVKLKFYPQEVLDQLRVYTKETVAEVVGTNAFNQKVYQSYTKFLKNMGKWSELTEKAYYNQIQEKENLTF